jgi:ankyrin repeat protein
MLALVEQLKWKEIKSAIHGNPELIRFRDKKGRNWLHLCCKVNIKKRGLRAQDTIRTAEVLLRAGLDINAESASEGRWKATPLWHSIAFGQNLALSEYLLKHGSDPNHCLWAAAYNDDADAIRLLFRHGAEDPTTRKSSPFLASIQWGRFAAAEEFLKQGADVDVQDAKKMTALHYLLKQGRDKKYVRMLINYGARGDIRNASGIAAAEIMVRKRDSDYRKMAARFLLKS